MSKQVQEAYIVAATRTPVGNSDTGSASNSCNRDVPRSFSKV